MSEYQDYEHLLIEREGTVLTATLNRPEKLNAIDARMHRELEDFFEEVALDDQVNAIVITGAGRGFCSGGDVAGMGSGGSLLYGRELPGGIFTRGGYRLIRNLASVPQPVIAAVNGDAIGLGATIALCSDVVLVSDRARFGDTHVKVGLVAGDGGAVIWPLLLGLNRAKEYLMTGDLIPAIEAERLGLANHVYPAEELMTRAKELAERLTSGPTYAIRWTKVSVNRLLLERINLILGGSLALEGLSAQTADHQEAVRAFSEKRPPKFTGR